MQMIGFVERDGTEVDRVAGLAQVPTAPDDS